MKQYIAMTAPVNLGALALYNPVRVRIGLFRTHGIAMLPWCSVKYSSTWIETSEFN